MFIIYDLIFLIVALIHLPLYLLRGKFHRSFAARLGFLPKGMAPDRPVWVHAVSVGEAMVVRDLLPRLRKIFPAKRFVLTSVTATGNKILRGLAAETDLVTYLPLDFSFSVRAAIDKIAPSYFILAETELWPNLISYLYKKNIPVITVNGRISDASFKGYRLARFLFRPLLKKISLFCVQTDTDKKRLEALGVEAGKIRVTGNMKFDAADLKVEAEGLIRCRRNLDLGPKDRLLVCGSTHPGEEEIILASYKALLADFPGLKLLIAPRHPERAKEIEKLVSRHGFVALRLSQPNQRPTSNVPRPVFILDTVGELLNYYAVADIVFVGGSLVRKGGHNILEPAVMEKPILIGPHMFNFRDIAELFLAERAALAVDGRDSLVRQIRRILSEPSEAAALGQRGRKLILKNQGAAVKTINCFKEHAF